MDWFYAKHGKQEGPVSLETIREKFKSGEISATDLVWKEGMAEWTAASKVPEVIAPDPKEENEAPAPPPQTSLGGLGSSTSSGGTGGPVKVSDDELGLPSADTVIQNSPGTPALATASLVCGIIGLVCCGPGFLFGIGAVVCGHMQMGRYKRNPDDQAGKGLAVAGLVTGYLALVIGLILIGFWIVGFFAELSKVTVPV